MWANLLNISSRGGAGGCLRPRDMQDEANNFVMGLLFLSGDGREGGGGQGPEGRGGGCRPGIGARLLLWKRPKPPGLWGREIRVSPRPSVPSVRGWPVVTATPPVSSVGFSPVTLWGTLSGLPGPKASLLDSFML